MQYAFGYHLKGDRAQLKTIVDNPGEIRLQPYNQSLVQPVALKRLKIDQGDRYLGVRISMNGTLTNGYKYRLHKHKILGDTIN